MNKPAQFVEDLPTVENTEPVSLYRSTSPFYYRDHDKYILCYGSDEWTIEINKKQNESSSIFKVLLDKLSELDSDGKACSKQEFEFDRIESELLPQYTEDTISLKVWIFILKDCLLIHINVPISDNLTLRLSYNGIARCELRKGQEIYIEEECNDFQEAFSCSLKPGDQRRIKYPLFCIFAFLDQNSALQEAYNALMDGVKRCRQLRDESSDYVVCDSDFEQEHISKEILLNENGQGDDELNDILLDVAPRTESSAMNVEINGSSIVGVKRIVHHETEPEREKFRRVV